MTDKAVDEIHQQSIDRLLGQIRFLQSELKDLTAEHKQHIRQKNKEITDYQEKLAAIEFSDPNIALLTELAETKEQLNEVNLMLYLTTRSPVEKWEIRQKMRL